MVYCNKCKYDFEIKVRTRQIDKEIEEVFFNCPHCSERYTVYFTNDSIRKKQKLIRARHNELFKTKDKKKVQKEINQMQTMLKNEMDNLKRKMLDTQ